MSGWTETVSACSAALCLGVARVAHRRHRTRRRARAVLSGGGPVGSYASGLRRWPKAVVRAGLDPLTRRFGWRIGTEALCLPAGLLVALPARSVVPALAGAVAVPLVGRSLRCRSRRASAERRNAALAQLCGTVAGDLRTGTPPHAALAAAVVEEGWQGSQDLAEAGRLLSAAARFGGDVPDALRAAARQQGAEGLAGVGACWQVAVDGGAGLAAGLDRIAAALRAERDRREELRAQLAGPRSTAVMLALLPAFGIVLGTGLGADPLHILLSTPAGLGCLAAGGVLEWVGLAWTSHIVRSAEAVT